MDWPCMEESEAADARNTLHILGKGGDNERWRPAQRRAVDGLQGLITRLQSEVEREPPHVQQLRVRSQRSKGFLN